MELAKYKACICEGSAENAIMDILLDNDLLIFTREEMLEEEVIRCRDGKRFEEKYLRKGFLEKLSVIRILDSRRENFKLSNRECIGCMRSSFWNTTVRNIRRLQPMPPRFHGSWMMI